MPQHDLDIANGSGAAVRGGINSALAALGSCMKGPNAPPAPVAGMLWVEDDNPTSTRWTLRVYDGADWIVVGIIDSTANIFEPASTAIGLSLIRAADAAAARDAISAGVRLSTSVAATSGSSIDFLNIPAGVRRVTAMWSGLSTSGTQALGIRLGTSAGFATTGYDGAQTFVDGTTVSGTAALSAFGGFSLGGAIAANLRHGAAEFTRLSGNTWVGKLLSGLSNTTAIAHAAGSITLAGELDRLRFTTAGADTFDAGTVNVSWEF